MPAAEPEHLVGEQRRGIDRAVLVHRDAGKRRQVTPGPDDVTVARVNLVDVTLDLGTEP